MLADGTSPVASIRPTKGTASQAAEKLMLCERSSHADSSAPEVKAFPRSTSNYFATAGYGGFAGCKSVAISPATHAHPEALPTLQPKYGTAEAVAFVERFLPKLTHPMRLQGVGHATVRSAISWGLRFPQRYILRLLPRSSHSSRQAWVLAELGPLSHARTRRKSSRARRLKTGQRGCACSREG